MSDSLNAEHRRAAGDFTGLNHIGIAVHNIDAVLPFYCATLGARLVVRQTLDDRGLDVCFVEIAGTQLELLAPSRPGTAIDKFLATRGQGVHHLAFDVASVQSGLDRLRDCGVRLIDETPRPGFHGEVAFAHPASTAGVLFELCGKPSPTSLKANKDTLT